MPACFSSVDAREQTTTTVISLTGMQAEVIDRLIAGMIPTIQRERSLGDNQVQDGDTRDVSRS